MVREGRGGGSTRFDDEEASEAIESQEAREAEGDPRSKSGGGGGSSSRVFCSRIMGRLSESART